ncbi:MAG: hypothetical protein Q9211_004874 [Gyalolechia sp. 1 TL-2023]
MDQNEWQKKDREQGQRRFQDGWFSGHPQEVVPIGLAGISGALKILKDGQAGAVKNVFRLDEREGVDRYKTNGGNVI